MLLYDYNTVFALPLVNGYLDGFWPQCSCRNIIVPHNVYPQMAIGLGYDAAYSSPFLLLDKPVVVLIMDRFDRAPYSILQVKAYVYDHRAEPRMQSDITARVKSELLRRGVLEAAANPVTALRP